MEGYITQFAVDTNKAYIETERELFNGPRGRFLLSLKLSIKMLVCEKGILKMQLEQWNSGVRRLWTLRGKGGGKWKDKGQMGMSFKKIMRIDDETSGCMRGGARFR